MPLSGMEVSLLADARSSYPMTSRAKIELSGIVDRPAMENAPPLSCLRTVGRGSQASHPGGNTVSSGENYASTLVLAMLRHSETFVLYRLQSIW